MNVRARQVLDRLPSIRLATYPSPLEELTGLTRALDCGVHVLVKRDDAIPFACGGNKVRKLEMVLADAVAAGADTLVTLGGVQSNHARVTAAAAARLQMACVLVLSGEPSDPPTGNALLQRLYGATIEHVPTRADRVPAARSVIARLRRRGRRPYEIPLGASTGLGALGYARAVAELVSQIPAPDVIVHSTSSGGTQAGLVAGLAIHGLATRVIGISADEPEPALTAEVARVLGEIEERLGEPAGSLAASQPIVVDAGFVGEGYGVPTVESSAAIAVAARGDALLLDPTYTAKAMAGLMAYARTGRFSPGATVVFWHTGGLPGLFAAPAAGTGVKKRAGTEGTRRGDFCAPRPRRVARRTFRPGHNRR
jgi:1-aminocyclopropane-1-carboxylate deaminase/D-cysteine desulfhydrase-like pyridoxal-dependent ACC family enzyme